MCDADVLRKQLVLGFAATLSGSRDALGIITTHLRAQGLHSDLIDDVNIVLGEVFINIARHGYPATTGCVRCRIRSDVTGVDCLISDEGVAYDPQSLGKPPMPQALAEGGYGWSLIHALCSSLKYERRAARNELHLRIVATP